jgi:dTDP-4-amino-4,6-dideoxygalactose transaminase
MKRLDKFHWPDFSSKEINIVSAVLQSNQVNYLFGTKGQEFESQFSQMVGTTYSLAVANGTLAIDLALRALGIKPGDEVLVTCRSFMATASSISLLGGIPVWCDVDLNSQNISIEEIERKFTKRTKAILCVHFAGFPCDMKAITAFAKLKKIAVVEDCAQAHGAKIGNRSVGSFGNIATWSFCNDKIMTLGGEGGMITTRSKKLYQFCEKFNNHGKNFTKYRSNKSLQSFPYIHDSIGSNYRLTEMQSALGIYQLGRLEDWHAKRARNASIFIKAIEDLSIVHCPTLPSNVTHAWYKLYLTLNPLLIKKNYNRHKIIAELNNLNVPAGFGGSGEMYREKAFHKLGHGSLFRLTNGRFLEDNSLLMMVHPTITRSECVRRAHILRAILKNAQK